VLSPSSLSDMDQNFLIQEIQRSRSTMIQSRPSAGAKARLLSELYLGRAPWMPDDGWGAESYHPRAPLLPTSDLMSHQCEKAGSHLVNNSAKNSETSVLIQLVPRLNLFHRSKQTNKHHVSIQFTSVMCV
jgi:hypothetical protein